VPGHHRGLAAVHRADGGRDLTGQIHLTDQRELCVKHDAAGAAGHRRGRRVQPDATGGPDRDDQLRIGRQPLDQHERGEISDPAAGLTATGDEPVGMETYCDLGLW
jgi:hypothetical protein